MVNQRYLDTGRLTAATPAITKEQRKALRRVWLRDTTVAANYRAFRKTVVIGSGCIMLQWKGMWLGIEPDGYTHS